MLGCVSLAGMPVCAQGIIATACARARAAAMAHREGSRESQVHAEHPLHAAVPFDQDVGALFGRLLDQGEPLGATRRLGALSDRQQQMQRAGR